MVIPARVTRLVRAASWRVSTKMAVGRALLLLSICGAIFLYFPNRVRDAAVVGLGNEARALSGVAAHTLTAPIVFDDTAAIGDVLGNLRNNPTVAWASVADMHGRRIGEAGALRHAGVNAAAAADGLTADGAYYLNVDTIFYDGRAIGVIRTALSTDQLNAEARQQRIHILAFSFVVFVVAMLASIVLQNAMLLTPLTHVADAARAIATGDTARRAAIETGDEIGSLANSFNAMVDQLFAAQQGLELANERLEQRVRDRTERLAEEIEERRRTELELKNSEERFRSLFERAPIGIALVDVNGCVFEFNEPLRRLLGYTADELRGLHVRQLMESADFDHNEMPGALLQRDVTADAFCIGKHRRISARIALSAVTEESNEIRFVSMMVLDLTAEKELEAKFRQAQKLEAVGRLAGGIAHDFNNLLTTINGFSDLVLQEMPEDDARRSDVVEIKKSGDRAALLTRQLLAFSRQQILQPRILELNAVVADAGRMLKRLIGDNIEFRTNTQANLPSVKLDPGQIVQVLLNLAVNARDAMPNGGVLEISTSKRTLSRADARELELLTHGDYVQLAVRDTGCGIPGEILPHVFEPFFTTKEVGKGTGLGLATVYGIVKQSGGTIAVTSERGRGTEFSILFPALQVPALTIESQERQAMRGNETILIAEDEPTVRRYVSRVLQRAGYRVLESGDGVEAMTVAMNETSPIDLLLTDAVMPRMSGAELMRQLQRERPQIKTLFMSGYTRDTMKEQGVDVGETAFLQKPVSPDALTNAVRAVLDSAPIEPVAAVA